MVRREKSPLWIVTQTNPPGCRRFVVGHGISLRAESKACIFSYRVDLLALGRLQLLEASFGSHILAD